MASRPPQAKRYHLMTYRTPRRSRWESRSRQEASSQAIHETIRMVEEALDIEFRRGSNPRESRDIMVELAGLAWFKP